MLLAALSAEGWAMIVGAIGLVAVQLYGMRLASQKEAARIQREDEKAERDATAAALTDQREREKLERDRLAAEKLVELGKGVEGVRVLADGMSRRYAEKSEQAGHSAGIVQERERADAAAALLPTPAVSAGTTHTNGGPGMAAEVTETNANVKVIGSDVKGIVKEAVQEVVEAHETPPAKSP